VENKLHKKYDPDGFQIQTKEGKIYRVDELSREDLIQVACDGIEALEQLESVKDLMAGTLDSWKNDKLEPRSE
jgi:hypothetical protein